MKAPTMIAFGDADSIPPAHTAEFFKLLGGGLADGGWDGSGMPRSRLAVLPGTTHYTIFSSPALASLVDPFLHAPVPSASATSRRRGVGLKPHLRRSMTAPRPGH